MPPRKEPQKTLGLAVRELRTERGMTQEELAHRSGLHPTWISRVEGGSMNPAWSSVMRLCRGLDVPISELARRVERLEQRSEHS